MAATGGPRAATIAVALVGMIAGMLGVQGLLLIANAQTGDGRRTGP